MIKVYDMLNYVKIKENENAKKNLNKTSRSNLLRKKVKRPIILDGGSIIIELFIGICLARTDRC